MSGLLATLSRELRSYFLSPLAYVILALMLLINGGVFWVIVSFLNDPRAAPAITPLELFFGQTLFFWLVLLMVSPALTMRSLSEERRSGTVEILMTAPVGEGQVVTGKYLASLIFYVALWAPTVLYAVLLTRYSAVDWGPVLAGYVGTFGLGAMFLAIGIFASSLTRSQLVSALTTFAMLMALFSVGLLSQLFTGETSREVLGYLNLWEHMTDFSKGLVDTRRLVLYASTAVLFLALASRSLEVRKWR